LTGLLSFILVLAAIITSLRWTVQWVPTDWLNMGIAAGQVCVYVESEEGLFDPGLDVYPEDWPFRAWPALPASYVPGEHLVALSSLLLPVAGAVLLGYVLWRRPRRRSRSRRLNTAAIVHAVRHAMDERIIPVGELRVACPICDYDVRAATGNKCPECGNHFNSAELVIGQYDLDPSARVMPPLRWSLWFRRTGLVGLCGVALCTIGFVSAGAWQTLNLEDYTIAFLTDKSMNIVSQWRMSEWIATHLLVPTGLIGAFSGTARLVLGAIYRRSIARQRVELLKAIASLSEETK
jgi:hypothetical protein